MKIAQLQEEVEKLSEALECVLPLVEHKAYELASEYHSGQVDKFGVPYLHHVVSVAKSVKSVEDKVVALLHDIMEDTTCTREQLIESGIPPYLVESIEALTRKDGESYKEFILRVSLDERATRVKLADLKDNLDEDDARYVKACMYLNGAMPKSKVADSLKQRYREAIRLLSEKQSLQEVE